MLQKSSRQIVCASNIKSAVGALEDVDKIFHTDKRPPLGKASGWLKSKALRAKILCQLAGLDEVRTQLISISDPSWFNIVNTW